jgi:hypothetical protein
MEYNPQANQGGLVRGIEFEVVWWDEDVIEYRVTCSNGAFSGATKMYAAHESLPEAADSLDGFPLHNKDSRTIHFGTPDPKFAGGGLQMRFDCVDSVGHAVVEVKLRADSCLGVGEAQSVSLYIPVEAGAIDAFVAQARSLADSKSGKAFLVMADYTLDWVGRWSPRHVG